MQNLPAPDLRGAYGLETTWASFSPSPGKERQHIPCSARSGEIAPPSWRATCGLQTDGYPASSTPPMKFQEIRVAFRRPVWLKLGPRVAMSVPPALTAAAMRPPGARRRVLKEDTAAKTGSAAVHQLRRVEATLSRKRSCPEASTRSSGAVKAARQLRSDTPTGSAPPRGQKSAGELQKFLQA